MAPGRFIMSRVNTESDMHEVDDQAVQISAVFVDTRVSVLSEAGDLIQVIENGVVTVQAFIADFSQLCGQQHTDRAGRNTP